MSLIKKHPLIVAEEETQKFWEDNKIFEKSVDKEALHGDYKFYDGPPFATGTPHYGHLVGSAMKDAVPRFWTMRGYKVARRWGWDCHGLPIENIVEKELGFKHKKDIEEYGIEKFNEMCRTKVLEYADIWRQIIPRFGRWADMDNAYSTMSRDYMESVWSVFKSLWDKELIYEGYKTMHVCPRCETTLSQQEVSEGYKMIKDWSVTVKFELVDEPGTYLLAWTTTPWTLPGNVALAVGRDIEYVVVEVGEKSHGALKGDGLMPGMFSVGKYIFAKDVYKKFDTLLVFASTKDVIEKYKNSELSLEDVLNQFPVLKGGDLVGEKYKPPFDYYLNKFDRKSNSVMHSQGLDRSTHLLSKTDEQKKYDNAYSVIEGAFVVTNEGTGIVHIAPAFGEDDLHIGQDRNLPFIQNVTLGGIFTDEVTDFPGLHVKPIEDHMATDVEIIKYLARKGLLFAKEKYEHSYPHCWRCDTPLLNYATSSWFVNVNTVKNKALDLAKRIEWFPEHMKEGRFGKWLEGARDWSISRQRFWASVMPVWKCACGELRVFGSAAELEEASGKKIDDLHKHVVDTITVPCAKCSQDMKRIPDVLDTWFDSGSMPYAQEHYLFDGKNTDHNFTAQFIAEGMDQTRAWFYYLHVLATALIKKPVFEHVIVNGTVLAEDGKKMSKKLKNYPEVSDVLDRYGADALRYYLLTSPVVAAENLNFSEAGVKESFQKVVMLLNNVVKFYELYAGEVKTDASQSSKHILDHWLIAKLNQLIHDVTIQMESYDLSRAARPIQDFIDELSTWWLRRSRDRFKSDAEKSDALATLQYTLLELSKVMAPFTPFIAESVYKIVGGDKESVHLDVWPVADASMIDNKVLEGMDFAREVVELALAKRAEAGIKIRQPLSELVVTGPHTEKLQGDFDQIIMDEVNVKNITLSLADELTIALNTEITPELAREGLLREFIRTVNDLRKKQGFTIADRITVQWQSESVLVREMFADGELLEQLKQSTLANAYESVGDLSGGDFVVNDEKIKITIAKN